MAEDVEGRFNGKRTPGRRLSRK